MRKTALLTTLILIVGSFALLTGCRPAPKGQMIASGNASSTAPTASPSPFDARRANEPVAVEVALDATASSDLSVLQPVVEALIRTIEEQPVAKVGVVRLGEEGKTSWAENLRIFDLLVLPTDVFDEGGAERSIEQSCWARLRCRQQRLEKLRHDHDLSLADRTKEATADRKARSLEIADRLLAPLSGEATCSDIVGFRDRLITDGYKLIILITDGDHSCQTEIDTKRFHADAKVLVLQMPLKGERADTSFHARTKQLQDIFVGNSIKIVPAVSANRELFLKFVAAS